VDLEKLLINDGGLNMISIIKYGDAEGKKLVDAVLSRSQLENKKVQETVDGIIANIRANGDKALFDYTKQFDRFDVNAQNILITKAEIDEAYSFVDSELIEVIKKSAARIAAFHEKQKINSWLEPSKNGEMLGQLVRPLESVGVYVPGGKAAYPSSVLMNIIPAKVAGVENIIMTTPPNSEGKVNPTTIVAADIAGVDKIYKVGGAQAVAALAFGTESVPKVDKIVGPGNIFVALAKRSVYGYVNIDSVAGPSEILVLADDSANPEYVAADLLSQAEHDEMASAILITTSEKLANEVAVELDKQTARLERKEIIEKSIANYGAIILVKDFDEACTLSNAVAPEHMEVCTREPFALLPKIQNAGAIFLGHYTPEPLGDYMAGPNHVLPTGGTARFFSPLSIDDYIKKSSLISFSEDAFKALGENVIKFAEAEGLTAHANSVKVRLK
jgi:histidinol dehydrogenase